MVDGLGAYEPTCTPLATPPLSGLNFARYTGQYGSYMPSSPLGVYKPLV